MVCSYNNFRMDWCKACRAYAFHLRLGGVRWPVFVYCMLGTIWKSYAYMIWESFAYAIRKWSYCISSNMT